MVSDGSIIMRNSAFCAKVKQIPFNMIYDVPGIIDGVLQPSNFGYHIRTDTDLEKNALKTTL